MDRNPMERTLVRKGILFVLMGPTASGKSTLSHRLLEEFPDSLHSSVSLTSRVPRPLEVPGKSYHFVSRDEFQGRVANDEFFEWEEIHGNLYGTLRSTLLDGIDSGRDLLFQIDVRGALNFKRTFPENTVTVFILPPSFAILKERLQSRAPVPDEELRRRFSTAAQEYGALLRLATDPGKVDYLVVNHQMQEAFDQVRAILLAERARYRRMDLSSVKQFCEISLDL